MCLALPSWLTADKSRLDKGGHIEQNRATHPGANLIRIGEDVLKSRKGNCFLADSSTHGLTFKRRQK